MSGRGRRSGGSGGKPRPGSESEMEYYMNKHSRGGGSGRLDALRSSGSRLGRRQGPQVGAGMVTGFDALGALSNKFTSTVTDPLHELADTAMGF